MDALFERESTRSSEELLASQRGSSHLALDLNSFVASSLLRNQSSYNVQLVNPHEAPAKDHLNVSIGVDSVDETRQSVDPTAVDQHTPLPEKRVAQFGDRKSVV